MKEIRHRVSQQNCSVGTDLTVEIRIKRLGRRSRITIRNESSRVNFRPKVREDGSSSRRRKIADTRQARQAGEGGRVQRGETDMLDARRKRMLNIVEARDVDVVHRAVGRVRHGRLEVHAREGRRRVGVGHVDEGHGVMRLLLLVVLEVKLALLRERGMFRGRSERRRGRMRGGGEIAYMRRGEGGGVDVEPGLLQHLREVWLRNLNLRLADALTRTLRSKPRASSKSSRRHKSREVARLVGSCRGLLSRSSSSSDVNRNGSGGGRNCRDTRNIVDFEIVLIRSETLPGRGLPKIAKVHSTICCCGCCCVRITCRCLDAARCLGGL